MKEEGAKVFSVGRHFSFFFLMSDFAYGKRKPGLCPKGFEINLSEIVHTLTWAGEVVSDVKTLPRALEKRLC